MSIEVKIPESGESVHEVQIAQWLKAEGQWVEKDEDLVEIDTDKATLQVPAPTAGYLAKIVKKEGEMAEVGEVIAQMDESSERPAKQDEPKGGSSNAKAPAQPKAAQQAPQSAETPERQRTSEERSAVASSEKHVMPAAKRMLAENQLSADQVEATGPGGRLLKEDVQRHLRRGDGRQVATTGSLPAAGGGSRQEEVVPMSMIRRRIAQRLVEAQQSAALLTTFNEIDMSAVMQMRKQHRDEFQQEYGIKLGFMSFFVKAAVESLKRYPAINAEVRGTDIVYRNYYDIGIAVGGGKGLVVPVLRNAERMSFADIERTIDELAKRAQANKLKPEELEGGTFSISNGGIYGSLLSTPIVNPPQSGILGLHAIQERPVARDGQVVIRPMMYVALSYDHRIVDGREAVSFLRHLKDVVEEPSRMLIEI